MSSTSVSYHLGVDLGTTYAGAGILRDGRPEVVTLGARSAVIPSVLYFREDGEILVGEPANRRGLMDPSRVVREFKRRVGDSTPMVVGSTPYSAEALLARLLRFVHDEVVNRQGSAPASVTVTHPANWGAYKIDVLQQAVRMAEIGKVETLAEPVAAAVHYAATERLESGGAVAVYDLGGGTFDAAVVRRTAGSSGGSSASSSSSGGGSGGGSAVGGGTGFELLGDVEGIERLGGIDLDEAVFQHVVRWCESAFAELDPDDPAALQALARVRQECVAAKEALSADTDVTIPVVLPNLQTEVRLTRAEFEAMIRPLLQQTVEALRRAVRSANVDVGDLAAVLLVGGSSQIPLAAELVGADLGRPIAVDQHPKHTVSLGAAIAGGRRAGATPVEPPASAAPAGGSATLPSTDPIMVTPTASPDPVVELPAVSAASTTSPTPFSTSPPMSSTSHAAAGGPLTSLIDDTSSTGADATTTQWQSPPGPSSGLANRRSDTMVMPSGHSDGAPPYGGDSFNASGPGGPRGTSRLVPVVGALVVALIAIGGAIWAIGQRGTASDPGEEGDVAAGSDEIAGVPAAAEATSTTATTVGSSTTDIEAAEPRVSTTTPTSTVTSPRSTTATTTTTTAVAGFSATITDIVIEGGRYAVSYSTNFSPLISSDPSSTHLHFFFDTVPVAQAGVPGGGPWILYDIPSPFTGYAPSDRPSRATQLCVTAANHAHEVVDPAIYHCMALPDA